MAKGRKKKKKMLICEHCSLGSTNKKEFKSCRMCRKVLCLYHQKPEAHGCDAVDWEGLQAKRKSGFGTLGDMTLIDLLKAGAVVLAVILIAKMVFGLFSRLWNYVLKLWKVAKAQAAVLVAVPLLLSIAASIFPGGAEFLDENVDTLVDTTGLDDVRIEFPQLSELELDQSNDIAYMAGVNPVAVGLPKISKPKVSPLEGLKGCTNSMTYSSMLETYKGQKCVSLCKERGYSSYGIVKNGNSLDCYCCHGSGTPIE